MTKSLEAAIHEQIGGLVVGNIALQRQAREAAEAAEAAFSALDQCIMSGQVPTEDVPALVASIPGFAQWRGQQRKAE